MKVPNFLLATVLLAAFVYAQEVTTPESTTEPSVQAESGEIRFLFGFRYAFGVSALRGHKAVKSDLFGPSIRLEPALSLGTGMAFGIQLNNVLTVAPELQYTLYRAKGELIYQTDYDIGDELSEAGVNLYSLEMPVLIRLNFGSAYTELGPQVGYNYYAKIYRNYEFKKPRLKHFAFGPSLGGGVNLGGVLLGVRGYFGLLEYARDTKGYPWAAHFSITKFLIH